MTLQTRPLLERTRHPTMAEAALAELRDSILSGELAPGAPLRLEELAERLGMSISPVREAVRRLESLGLAVHVPHRGARVSELALDDLRDTYEVRLVLEPLAVRKAAEPLHRPRRGGVAAAPDRVRPGARARRSPSGAHGPHRLPLRALLGGGIRVAPPADPSGVGELRALPRDLAPEQRHPRGRAGARADPRRLHPPPARPSRRRADSAPLGDREPGGARDGL